MSSGQQVSNKIERYGDLNKEEGRYIYCIIGTSEGRKFSYPAIGGCGDEVYSISYQDAAAVISATPVMKYPISRENTMAHQKVLEELMGDFTVLPVKFGTVASSKDGVSASERIKEDVLKVRYEELKELLTKMDGRIELGLKAFWVDMKIVFGEIVDENSQIRRLRQRLVSRPITQP
ncbi:MAG: GvpL/GvpF family gas vesicle protein, partial [Candidatus Omnitrophica bacterium]|nr:GvpL/GvpF family gas vesicle protein [Candidatus Omnitrophota bacterium]